MYNVAWSIGVLAYGSMGPGVWDMEVWGLVYGGGYESMGPGVWGMEV